VHLTVETVDGFVALQHAALSAPERAERSQQLLAELPELDAECYRVAVDGSGAVVAALRMFEPYAGHIALLSPKCLPGAEHRMAPLAAEVVALARRRGLDQLHTRLPREGTPPAYLASLETQGFRLRDGRVEFKTPVADLPAEGATPLDWVSYETIGLGAAGALFERAGAGPEWERTDVGTDLITGYLKQEGMYTEPDCVQIGSLHGTPVAFVVAQVEPSSGWSTITFMGLVEQHRGKGLGTWVHRHGMAMMRAQGGLVYHGGTSLSNLPMRRLFAKHGCREFAQFVELTAQLQD
jgi:hypothetical protein